MMMMIPLLKRRRWNKVKLTSMWEPLHCKVQKMTYLLPFYILLGLLALQIGGTTNSTNSTNITNLTNSTNSAGLEKSSSALYLVLARFTNLDLVSACKYGSF